MEREVGNAHDSYAVSVTKDDSIVGHVPRELSRICWRHILGHGGTIDWAQEGHGGTIDWAQGERLRT